MLISLNIVLAKNIICFLRVVESLIHQHHEHEIPSPKISLPWSSSLVSWARPSLLCFSDFKYDDMANKIFCLFFFFCHKNLPLSWPLQREGCEALLHHKGFVVVLHDIATYHEINGPYIRLITRYLYAKVINLNLWLLRSNGGTTAQLRDYANSYNFELDIW